MLARAFDPGCLRAFIAQDTPARKDGDAPEQRPGRAITAASFSVWSEARVDQRAGGSAGGRSAARVFSFVTGHWSLVLCEIEPMPKIFHIRDRRPHNWRTLCGDETTRHDNRFSWQPFPAGDYVPCPKCVAKREALKRAKHQPLATQP